MLSATIWGLTSCLKNNNLVLDPAKSPAVVGFSTISDNPAGIGAGYTLYVRAYDIGPSAAASIDVVYAGSGAAPSDVTVNLDLNQAAIDAYNTANDTHYELMPTSLYTSPTSVVIKKGERKATLNFTFKTNGFDLTKNYVLPLRIASLSAGTISGNYGTIIMAVNAKNKYDGRYTITGTMVDATNSTFTAKSPSEADLYTQSGDSNAMFDFSYSGTFGHRFLAAGSNSYYGSYAPVFTFDAAGNITKVVNYYGQPASNGRSAALDPSGQNKFTSGTPGVKGATFKVKYFLLQPGSTVRTSYDETWVLEGPRP